MAQSEPAITKQQEEPKVLPKGVVLGPDGKPCKSCTSFASWAALTRSNAKPNHATATTPAVNHDCPPDVEALGRSTWTLLHATAAQYPEQPSDTQQASAASLIKALSQLYPCWTCAGDFRQWLAQEGNTPRVGSRGEFGQWMCEAHNAVNVKLGKQEFDCSRWLERWRAGWKDSRCD